MTPTIVHVAQAWSAVGLVVALAFVALGLPRVAGVSGPRSIPFRLIVIPGAMLLWPLVIQRWMRMGRTEEGAP